MPTPFSGYGGLLGAQFDNYSQPDIEGANNLGADAMALSDESAKAAQAQAEGPPLKKYSTTFDKDGLATHSVELSDSAMQFIQQMMGVAQSSIAEKNQLELRLKAKRDVLEANPGIAEIGRVLSLAATAYQAPNSRGEALVHAAGAYGGTFFNDTPESLQAQIAATESAKMRDLSPVYAALSQEQHIAHQDKVEQAREDRFEARQDRAYSQQQLQYGDQISDGAMKAAAAGDYTPGLITQRYITALGDTPANRSKAAALEAMAKSAADNHETQQKKKEADGLAKFKEDQKVEQGYRVALENLRFEHEKQLHEADWKGAPAILNGFNTTQDDFRQVRMAQNQAVNTLEAERQRMDEIGIPGFDDPNITPQELTARLQVAYGKVFQLGDAESEKKGKKFGLRNQLDVQVLPDELGVTQQNINQRLQAINQAGAAYKTAEQAIPGIIARYDEYRKAYKSITKQDMPPLTVDQAVKEGKVPKGVEAKKMYSYADLEAMTLAEYQSAVQQKLVPATIPRERLRALAQEKMRKQSSVGTGRSDPVTRIFEGYGDTRKSGAGGF